RSTKHGRAVGPHRSPTDQPSVHPEAAQSNRRFGRSSAQKLDCSCYHFFHLEWLYRTLPAALRVILGSPESAQDSFELREQSLSGLPVPPKRGPQMRQPTRWPPTSLKEFSSSLPLPSMRDITQRPASHRPIFEGQRKQAARW